MKLFAVLLLTLTSLTTFAEEKIKFNANNEEITTVIKNYSVASGQKFILDATVRGKISIFNQGDITLEDAFNQLSAALATNGFAISKQGDLYVIKSARSTQRDYIDVSSTVPSMNPVRMHTWVVNLKNIAASDVLREVRMLTSSFGEMSTHEKNNQLIITDWTTNLNRIAEILKQIDKPADPAVAKIVATAKKERSVRLERKFKDKGHDKGNDKEKKEEDSETK